MEPKTLPRDDIKQEADVNDLIPRFKDIGCDGSFHDAVIVIFDLDLTDMSREKEICQISAQCNGNPPFNKYIIPDQRILPKCTKYHGIKIRGVENQRELLHYGNRVDAVSPQEGLKLFLDYLSNQTGRVLLVAHNCFKFECWTLIRLMRRYNLFDRFESLVLGFIDTISVFKSRLSEANPRPENFKFLSLAAFYSFHIPENFHAVVYVEILGSLITRVGGTNANMIQDAKNLAWFMTKVPEEVEARVIDLQPLNDIISGNMIAKIARAGISMNMLQHTYNESGVPGVSALLRGEIDDKIQAIIARLAALAIPDNQDAPI